MSGLPNTRPTADTFGPDVVDDDDILDPELETPADIFNLIRAALAFCGQVASLTVTSFTGLTGVVRTARGGVCTCTRLGAGQYQIDTVGGWVIESCDAVIQSQDITISNGSVQVQVTSATQALVRIYDNGGSLADQNFLFKAW